MCEFLISNGNCVGNCVLFFTCCSFPTNRPDTLSMWRFSFFSETTLRKSLLLLLLLLVTLLELPESVWCNSSRRLGDEEELALLVVVAVCWSARVVSPVAKSSISLKELSSASPTAGDTSDDTWLDTLVDTVGDNVVVGDVW